MKRTCKKVIKVREERGAIRKKISKDTKKGERGHS